MLRKVIIVSAMLVIVVLSVLGMNYLANKNKPPQDEKHKDIKLYVKVQAVEYSTVTTSLQTEGRLESQAFVDLSSEVQGKILSGGISLKKGQNFQKGQVLAHIYKEEAILALKSKKSTFLNTIANILPDMKIDYPDSYQQWYKFFTSIEIDKDLPEMPKPKTDQEKVFLAGRNIQTSYYSIQSDEIRLEKYTIVAPFSGTFSEVYMEVGSIANPGSKIARMIRTDQLELEVPVESSKIHWIQQGDKPQIFDETGTEVAKGTVTRISRLIDAKSQAVSVFIALDPAASKNLFQGSYLKAIFGGKTIANSMEIPRNAVFNNNDVFVMNDGKLEVKQINILKHNTKTLVFNGLEVGDSLVVQPLINMASGTRVYPLE